MAEVVDPHAHAGMGHLGFRSASNLHLCQYTLVGELEDIVDPQASNLQQPERLMKRISNLLAWGALAIVGALCVLNWGTLSAQAPLDLVLWQIQAPLGIVLLGVAGVIFAFFLMAYLYNQIGSLLETRKLLKEIRRVQELADKAEASRMENLHQLISTEFRLLNERMGSASVVHMPNQRDDEDPRPLSLTELVARR